MLGHLRHCGCLLSSSLGLSPSHKATAPGAHCTLDPWGRGATAKPLVPGSPAQAMYGAPWSSVGTPTFQSAARVQVGAYLRGHPGTQASSPAPQPLASSPLCGPLRHPPRSPLGSRRPGLAPSPGLPAHSLKAEECFVRRASVNGKCPF